MSDQERTGSSNQVNMQGTFTGQFAIGDENRQLATSIPADGQLPPEALRELEQFFTDLKVRVEREAPPECRQAAVERVAELEEAVKEAPPNLTTMEYVRNWFGKNVPALAGAVTALVIHPVVGKLVEAAGEAAVTEFRRRFGIE